MVYVLLVKQENETWPDAAKGNLKLFAFNIFEVKQKGFYQYSH